MAVQLMRAETSSGPQSGLPVSDAFVPPVPAATAVAPPSAQTDLWTPAEAISQATRSPVPVQAPEPAAVAVTDIAASSPAAEPSVAPVVDVAVAGPDLEAAPLPGEPATVVEPHPEGTVASDPVPATEPVASETEVASE
ncbi:MAG: hypothetical protein EBR23_15325, partial [Planctomycetia bacterium]|nr:hypothetical protein [Planctomycetia bacterium]